MERRAAVILIVALATICLVGPTAAQVQSITADFNRVYFATSKVGFAVGKKGAIYRTDNAGHAWTAQDSGTQSTLNSAHFTGTSRGWACGDQGLLLRTTDGGKAWTPIDLKAPDTVTDNLHKIFFIGPDNGWICGDHGLLLHTTDGGDSWVLVHSNTRHNLEDMVWISSLEGWIVGGTTLTRDNSEDIILHTVNGGNTWAIQKSSVPKDYLRSVSFINARAGWAVGDTVVFTDNGGKTWTDKGAAFKDKPLLSVGFIDANRGWIGAAHGILYHTDDGGRTWQTQKIGTTRDIVGIFVYDETVYAVGSNPENGKAAGAAILRTSNAGKTWEH